MPKSISVRSFAKINLNLHVLGKREDSYHEIASIFQTVSLFDSITVEETESDQFTCDDDSLPTDSSNLAVKALSVFREMTGIARPVSIHLTKRIPSPGGLGGGSSNAAVTLLALDRLFETGIDTVEFDRVAASLGADVPFFLHGGTAFCSGIGERVEQLKDWEETRLLLVSPEVAVDTPWAYKHLSKSYLTKQEAESILKHYRLELNQLYDGSFKFENEFRDVVFSEFPLIKKAFEVLSESTDSGCGLSGTGPTLFGRYSEEIPIRELESSFDSIGVSRIYPVRTIGSKEYKKLVFDN